MWQDQAGSARLEFSASANHIACLDWPISGGRSPENSLATSHVAVINFLNINAALRLLHHFGS
jgi:hypothetical protein